jgi:hypothetical protein
MCLQSQFHHLNRYLIWPDQLHSEGFIRSLCRWVTVRGITGTDGQTLTNQKLWPGGVVDVGIAPLFPVRNRHPVAADGCSCLWPPIEPVQSSRLFWLAERLYHHLHKLIAYLLQFFVLLYNCLPWWVMFLFLINENLLPSTVLCLARKIWRNLWKSRRPTKILQVTSLGSGVQNGFKRMNLKK